MATEWQRNGNGMATEWQRNGNGMAKKNGMFQAFWAEKTDLLKKDERSEVLDLLKKAAASQPNGSGPTPHFSF